MVLDPHRWLELRFRGLYESGAMSLREIAKETGLNRRTVGKYLSGETPVVPPRRAPNGRPAQRMVDEVAPLIDAMLRAEILLKGAVIHERLVAEYGFAINYQRVKIYLQEARPASRRNWASAQASWRGCTAGSRWCPGPRPRSTGVTRAGSSPKSASRRSTRST